MAETALVLAVLLLAVFGVMDFGRLMYSYHLVNNAARLGTRFAIVRGSQCKHYITGPTDTWPCPTSQAAAQTEIRNYVQQQSVLMGLGNVTVPNPVWSFVQGCSPPTGTSTYNNQPGCQVAVTVQYPFSFFMPFMPGTSITLSSTSKMLISF